MLHIILLILKILGIILLSIIGIVFAIVLLVLFSPVRYRIQADYFSKPHMEFRASYLLHIVRATGCYENDEFILRVKVLWFTIYQIPELEINEQKETRSYMDEQGTKSGGKTVFDEPAASQQRPVQIRQHKEEVQEIAPHSQKDVLQQKSNDTENTVSLLKETTHENNVLQIQEVSQEKEESLKINKIKQLLQNKKSTEFYFDKSDSAGKAYC